MVQYFMLANFDGESSFDEGMGEDGRLERLPLQIMEDLERILRKLTVGEGEGEKERRVIISEENVGSNEKMMGILMAEGLEIPGEKPRPSLLCMGFITLQSIFDGLGD